jgi:hypothetical protein
VTALIQFVWLATVFWPSQGKGPLSFPVTVTGAIKKADAILPGVPAPKDAEDARWQAIMRIEDFIPTKPEPIWLFVERWGNHPNEDLRTAVRILLVEQLLAHHFDLVFPRVESFALASKRFASSFMACWKIGQALELKNATRFDRLKKKLRNPPSLARR